MRAITDIYETIRLVKQRFQDLEKRASGLPDSKERLILVEALDSLVILARETETLAHHTRGVQDRLSDFATTIALLSDEIFGEPKGSA